METAISYLTVMPSNKEEVESFSGQVIDFVNEGNFDALKMQVQLNFIKKTIDLIEKGIEISVKKEADKYPEKTIYLGNSQITKTSRKTWDYSETGDYVIDALESQMTVLKEEIETRKKMLQTIPESGLIDENTGVCLYRAKFTSKEILTINLK